MREQTVVMYLGKINRTRTCRNQPTSFNGETLAPVTHKRNNKSVRRILEKLAGSLRGQIFLCNLDMGLRASMVQAGAVTNALNKVKMADIRLMHENNLLGHISSHLHSSAAALLLQNPRGSDYTAFASGGLAVSVLRRVDFETYYADPSDLISGHDFSKSTPGSSTLLFKRVAATNARFWAAPVSTFGPISIVENDAEKCRDLLGLVHYGRNVPLVAIHLLPPPNTCYRPTVIEAIPNARFRQLDPMTTPENRWGYTVDLELLNRNAVGARIFGMPELVFARASLADCGPVKFFHLGTTVTDKDTASADSKFLTFLLAGSSIETVVRSLNAVLAP